MYPWEKCETRSEVRALWVVRTTLVEPGKIVDLVDRAWRFGFNTLVVQVRGRGDSFYKSNKEPRAESLAGKSEDFDPLALVLELAKSRGIAVHAWLNVHFIWNEPQLPSSPEHIMNAHPDWIARNSCNQIGRCPTSELEGSYTCPSHPDVQSHLLGLYVDIARQYDIDGVHLDFVRYPNEKFCFCDGCLKRFYSSLTQVLEDRSPRNRSQLLAYARYHKSDLNNWRRKQITGLVARIYQEIKKIKPKADVTAAVFANIEDACEHRFQDWEGWLSDGILDALCPMAYVKQTRPFGVKIREAVQIANGCPVWAGIGAWRMRATSAVAKIKVARQLGAVGIILFSYDSMTDDGMNDAYLRYIQEHAFAD